MPENNRQASTADQLADDVAGFLQYLVQERGYSPATRETYAFALGRFRRFVAGGGVVSYLAPTAAELLAYVEALAAEGLAAPSRANRLTALRTFYHYLAERERLPAGVVRVVEAMPIPTTWERLPPRVLSVEEVGRLLAAPQPGERFYLRDAAILEILYATGLRASEMCDLAVSDLHLDTCSAVVNNAKGGKTRVVVMGPGAVEALRAYLGEQRPDLVRRQPGARWVFLTATGKRMPRESLGDLVRGYARRAGLPGVVSPHTLRHSIATHLMQSGMDVALLQALLGHSDVRTTQHYTHADVSHLQRVHQQTHPRGQEVTAEPADEATVTQPA